jgi:transcriptional regulator NrdR family protein
MSSYGCPQCNGSTTVTDSRPYKPSGVKRRRRCTSCGYRITTYECEEPPTMRDQLRIVDRLRALADAIDGAEAR